MSKSKNGLFSFQRQRYWRNNLKWFLDPFQHLFAPAIRRREICMANGSRLKHVNVEYNFLLDFGCEHNGFCPSGSSLWYSIQESQSSCPKCMQASWFNWMYLFVSFVHQVVVTLIAQIFVCLAHLLSWHLLILYSGVFNDSSTANVTESKSKSFYMSYAVLAFSFPRRILQFFLMLLIHLVFSHFSSTLLFFIQLTWIFRVVSS